MIRETRADVQDEIRRDAERAAEVDWLLHARAALGTYGADVHAPIIIRGANAGAPGENKTKPPNLPQTSPGGNKKASKKAIKQALDALKDAPPVDKGSKRIAVPFALAKDTPYDLSAGELAGAEPEDVPLNRIIGVEPTVKRGKVKDYIKEGGDFKPIPTLLCVKQGNRDVYLIGNGHHRCTAAWYLSLKRITANVIDTRGKN